MPSRPRRLLSSAAAAVRGALGARNDAGNLVIGPTVHELDPTRLLGSGLAHRIVWAPVQDALAAGWRVDEGDGADLRQDVARDIDALLDIPGKAYDALGTARIQGGAHLWPDWEDGATAAVLAEGPHPVTVVHAVEAREATPAQWDSQRWSPGFGRPRLWTVQMSRDGATATASVHASRMGYVPGAAATPAQATRRQGYDVPVLDLYAQAIVRAEDAWRSGSRLLDRQSMPWYRARGGAAVAAADADDGDGFGARMMLLKESMSVEGLLVLLGDDEVGWTGPTLAGSRDLITSIYEALAAVEGVPLSILMGQAPTGLSTDDASGQRNYRALKARIRQSAERALLHCYAVILGPDPSRRIVWGDLDLMTPVEYAAWSLSLAQRDEIAIRSGAVDDVEARARYADGEEVAELRLIERPDEPEPGMPPDAQVATVADDESMGDMLKKAAREAINSGRGYEGVAMARGAIEIAATEAEIAATEAETEAITEAPAVTDEPAE